MEWINPISALEGPHIPVLWKTAAALFVAANVLSAVLSLAMA
jgi:hypothetical protein